jgi:long-chain acyl-CoA synthetase
LDACDVATRGVVAVLLPNCSEYIYCLRGATWSGRTFTPVNWHLKPQDVAYIIENSEACVFVAHADFSEVAQSVAHLIPPEGRYSVGGEIPGFRSFEELYNHSDDELIQPLAGSIMMYTSGTTGRPKGVKPATPKIEAPPCAASKAGVMMLSTYLQDNAEGPHLVVAPLYHAAPITYAEGAALLGSDVVIMEKWDAEEFLCLVEQEKICSTFLVPTHLVRLLQLPEDTRAKYDLSSLKFVCHGAAPISKEVKRRVIDWLGPVLFEFYGGTEGGGISISMMRVILAPLAQLAISIFRPLKTVSNIKMIRKRPHQLIETINSRLAIWAIWMMQATSSSVIARRTPLFLVASIFTPQR